MTALTMRQIAEAAAMEHGFTLAAIVRQDRAKPIARARLEAMHACWSAKRWSLHQMAVVFQRHHTTVLSAAKKIEAEGQSVPIERAA